MTQQPTSATPYYVVDDTHSGELGREVWILGPPGCLAGPTRIGINRAGKGSSVRLDRLVTAFNGSKPAGQGGRLWDLQIPTYVQRAVGDTIRLGRLQAAWESGDKVVYQLATATRSIAATDEHPFLTPTGWAKLGELRVGEPVAVNAGQTRNGRGQRKRYASTYTRHHPRQRNAKDGFRVPTHRLVAEATLNGLEVSDYVTALRTDPDRCATFTYLTPDVTVHHRNRNHTDNRPDNLEILTGGQAEHAGEHEWGDNVLARRGFELIVSIRKLGEVATYDLEVADDPHCFVANGFVVHNTGKTTFLSGSVRNTATQRGADNVVVTSFTTAAAAELASRGLPLPRSNIGTLHSLAYRALEAPPVAVEQYADWNTRHPGWALSAAARTSVDDGAAVEAGVGGATEGDQLINQLDSLRARQIPQAKWDREVVDFADAWTAWKRSAGVVDFTDMIEQALEMIDRAPSSPDVIFADEVQDFTPLELSLVRKWGQHAERLVLAGDPNQCHPPGEVVRTTNRGDVPIEKLTDGDLLVSFDKRGGSEMRRRGYRWQRGCRPYSGEMITLSSPSGRTRVTPNHRLMARWTADACGKVVYLMRKGEHWRLGTSDLIRRNAGGNHFGPGVRGIQERADEMWLLSTHATDLEAQFAEDRLSTEYGISTMFRAPYCGVMLACSQDDLDAHHAQVAKSARPDALLAAYGRRREHPFWVPDRRQRGAKALLEIPACNYMPEVMVMPIDPCDSSKVTWERAQMRRDHFDGFVYSLQVEPYPHYVAGGFVVHNSIYGFKGATPDAWLDEAVPDSDKLVLSQSWRIPSTVHAAAEHWIRQQSRFEEMTYHPRDEPGQVRNIAENYLQVGLLADRLQASLEQTVVEDGESRPATAMVLASCGYMLDPIRHELRRRGIPFHNPYRRSRGDWNPMKPAGKGQVTSRERLLAYLILDERAFGEKARPWTGQDVKRWAHAVRKQGVFVRGAAARLAELPDGELEFEAIAGLFADDTELEQAVMPDLEWFERNLLAAAKPGMDFPLQVAKARGPVALTETPRIVLGTIHSVKGGQASHVYLIPDLSSRGSAEWETPGVTADGVRRLMYVGMTRARSDLAVLMPAGTLFVPPEEMVAGARAGAA